MINQFDSSFNLIIILFYLFTSYSITCFIIEFLIPLSHYIKLVAYPNHRKLHNNAIPLIGGISIFFTFLILSFVIDFIFFKNFYVILSLLIILLLGFLDDKYRLSVFYKLIFQFLASYILVFNVHFISSYDWSFLLLFNNLLISKIFSVILIVLIVNAMNFIDGVDGLLLGVSTMISLSFVFLLCYFSLVESLDTLVVFSGCLLAAFSYNRFPAKIFLGDLGSMGIGWFFAIYSFYFANLTSYPHMIMFPLILLSFPMLDLFILIYIRFSTNNITYVQKFLFIFKSDRKHFHHRLLNAYKNHNKVVLFLSLYIAFCLIISIISWIIFGNLKFGVMTVLVSFLSIRYILLE